MPVFHEESDEPNGFPKIHMIDSAREVPEDRIGDQSEKKLILCFDGTSNSFKGDDSDTNVVKLFEMFDRRDKQQYHYYQPGIGTYTANENVANVQRVTLGNKIASVWDEMGAGSFAEHVLAGYKFLMRYYMEGDKIYIFGFSRGAYTARFLTEMLDSVGLLSKGNEENLPFLWYQYSKYRRNPSDKAAKYKLSRMSSTFCRVEPPKDVKEEEQRPPFVYFLGLWDCVNSIAKLSDAEIETHANASPDIAVHVRHAVSCHERRVMFRPTLFLQQQNTTGTCVEQWFAGNHGDVGGGWPRNGNDLLLSDIPLVWMVQELQAQEKLDNDRMKISWRTYAKHQPGFKNTFEFRRNVLFDSLSQLKQGKTSNPQRLAHDTLSIRRSGFARSLTALPMVAVWWFMECLPLKHTILVLKRRGLVRGSPAVYTTKGSNWWNLGGPRRIPLESNAVINDSVELLYQHKVIPAMWRYGTPVVGGKLNASEESAEYRYFCPAGLL